MVGQSSGEFNWCEPDAPAYYRRRGTLFLSSTIGRLISKASGASMLKLLSCAALSLLVLLPACSGSSQSTCVRHLHPHRHRNIPHPRQRPQRMCSPPSASQTHLLSCQKCRAPRRHVSWKISPPTGSCSFLTAPDLATDEEAASLIGCMEDETLLRFFLSAILQATGPLSAESSGCVREVFADVDLAAPMIASVSDPDAGAGLMAGFFSTLVCLNEAEFQAAGPALELGNIDQQGVQCLFDELGGAEGLTALMDPAAGPPLALFGAVMTCNLELTADPVAAP